MTFVDLDLSLIHSVCHQKYKIRRFMLLIRKKYLIQIVLKSLRLVYTSCQARLYKKLVTDFAVS